jgi:two-component system OmpR family response regulator
LPPSTVSDGPPSPRAGKESETLFTGRAWAGVNLRLFEPVATFRAGARLGLEALARILIIEDDADTAAEIAACLGAAGYDAVVAGDGETGLASALVEPFDAVTLDRMLPGCDGLEALRDLRRAGVDAPVLMLSALGDVDDRVTGLRAGGDDYMVKPFAPAELLARLEVILRRRPAAREELTLTVGDLTLDLVTREACRGGRAIELLPAEFKLLRFMMKNAGQTLSRRMIFEEVWAYYFDPGTNLIDVHVGRLRRKIDTPDAAALFHTERGVGYRLA